MAYHLSSNKEKQTYNSVHTIFKDVALVKDPLSDFELAIVQVSTMSFSNSYHRGCYYIIPLSFMQLSGDKYAQIMM